MPSFETLARWERYEPSLGNNLSLPEKERFYLRICAGLTLDEYLAMTDRLQVVRGAKDTAAALAGIVELGDEPLRVRGQKVETLEAYVELAASQVGQDLLMELIAKVTRLNSIGGAQELFSERLSGGSRTTSRAPKTADARSGSATSPSPGPTPPRAPITPASSDGGSTSTASSAPPSAGSSTSTPSPASPTAP
jgi:hypothetical protein